MSVESKVAIVRSRICEKPFYQIYGKCVFGEVPVPINKRRHLHRVSCWKDGYLEHTPCINEDLPSQGVYVDCVAEMRLQKLVYRVEHAQLSVRCNHERLYRCMSIQPAHKFEHIIIRSWLVCIQA